MNNVPNISTIVQIADISEYLSSQKIAHCNFYGNPPIDKRLPILLLMERFGVDWKRNILPNDASLDVTGKYLYALCAPYQTQSLQIINNSTQSAPVITGPTNQTVDVGDDATFSVTVVSSLPVVYQWFLNGVPISGATSASYTKTNAQLSDSDGVYSVQASNSAGSSLSDNAILTVNAEIIAYTWYGDTDPNPMLQAGVDTLTYQIETPVVHNQPISITIPQVATPDKFFVTKIVNTESGKTIYFNTALNNGTIVPEDANYKLPYTFGTDIRYATRRSVSWDFTQPLILS